MSELQALLTRLLELLPAANPVWLKEQVIFARLPRPVTDLKARFVVLELQTSSAAAIGSMTVEELRRLNHEPSGTCGRTEMGAPANLTMWRDLRKSAKQLRAIAREKLLTSSDPELRARMAEQAQLKVVELKLRHKFLLEHLAPVLFDLLEFLAIERALRGEPFDPLVDLAVILKAPDRATRFKERAEARRVELLAATVKQAEEQALGWMPASARRAVKVQPK